MQKIKDLIATNKTIKMNLIYFTSVLSIIVFFSFYMAFKY